MAAFARQMSAWRVIRTMNKYAWWAVHMITNEAAFLSAHYAKLAFEVAEELDKIAYISLEKLREH